ncbi:MAG: YolD-like family protein [Candidatus Kapabacteria bacterium]|nr:YolD-like family protein [Candidatus Kapabacteria bacterium]MDW8011724.1 hypothetical protein [Bacteroidota bacterium]
MDQPTSERIAWLQGVRYLLRPSHLVPLLGAHAGKVFAMALLCMTGASVVVNWLYAENPTLREQMRRMAEQRLEDYFARHPEITEQQRAEIRQRLQEGLAFSLPRSLLGGLFTNVITLLSLAGLLWLLQPLVGVQWKSLSFAVLVTALGYCSLVGAAGEVITAVVQTLGGSIQIQPGLALFVPYEADPTLFSVLSRMHVGAIAQFGMLGYLFGRVAAIPLWHGMVWSFAAWGLWLGAIYATAVVVLRG